MKERKRTCTITISIVFAMLLTLNSFNVRGQGSIVYKRNIISNKLEVYQSSSSGLPTGSALYSLEKNSWGYLEIKDLRQNDSHFNSSLSPYSRRPNYEVISNRKPYSINYPLLVSQINELNKSLEYNASVTNNSGASYLKSMREIGSIEDGQTKELINLFSSITEFPHFIKDGWHKAFGYYQTNAVPNAVSNLFGNDKLMRLYYYVYVESGKPIHIFRLIDNKAPILAAIRIKTDVLGSLEKCQLAFRQAKSNSYETIYFLDEAIDHNYRLDIAPAFLNIKFTAGINALNGYLYNEASPPYGSINSFDDYLKIGNSPRQYTLVYIEKDDCILLPAANTTYSLKLTTSDYRYSWDIENISVKPNQSIYKTIGLK